MAADTMTHDDELPSSRRTPSLFSGRSNSSLSRALPSIAQAAVRETKALLGEQQRRIKARALSQRKTGQKMKHGTVLIAVPQAKPFKMTPLEEEMETGPNAEILSAIGQKSSGHISVTRTPNYPNPALATSPGHRKAATTNTSTFTPIGTWRNGVFHWHESLNNATVGTDGPRVTAPEDHTTVSQTTESTPKPIARPSLTVVIPAHEPLSIDSAIANLIRPSSDSEESPPIPPRAGVKARGRNRLVAIDEEASALPQTAAAVKDFAFVNQNQKPRITVTLSDSSSNSLSGSDVSSTDELSNTSSWSSTTSIEVDNTAGGKLLEDGIGALIVCEDVSVLPEVHNTPFAETPEQGAYSDKPLPPSPDDVETPLLDTSMQNLELYAREDLDLRRWGTSRLHEARCRSHVLPTSIKRAVTTGPQNDFGLPSQGLRKRAFRNDAIKRGASSENGTDSRRPTFELWAGPVPEQYATTKGALVGLPLMLESLLHGQQSPEPQSDSPVPDLPRRSRKRDWQGRGHVRNSKSCPEVLMRTQSESKKLVAIGASSPVALAKSQLNRRASDSRISRTHTSALNTETGLLTLSERPFESHSTDGIVIDDGLIPLQNPGEAPAATKIAYSTKAQASASRRLILGVLGTLPSLQDLFNAAIVNRSMYSLYKAYELELLHQVCYNESPAAWELGEWSKPKTHEADTEVEDISNPIAITPQSYLRTCRTNMSVIEALKAIVVVECRAFIREETASALIDANHPNSRHINDAFWRIWSFCHIFGGEKSREDDMVGQLDWLRGGPLAHNDNCVATVNANDDFEANSVLLNPPEYFAKGNEGGLSETALCDMMEIWTCLASLLCGYVGRVREARIAGVYDLCGPIRGDEGLEGDVLKEWICYLLTLGPAAVLGMAEYAKDRQSEGFTYADTMGWTRWNPLGHGGSRDSFFVEAASRFHLERTAATAQSNTRHTRHQRANSRNVLSMLEKQEPRLHSSDNSKQLSSAGSDDHNVEVQIPALPISKFVKSELLLEQHDSDCEGRLMQSPAKLTPPASPTWFSPTNKTISSRRRRAKKTASRSFRTKSGVGYMSTIREHGGESAITPSPVRYFGGVAQDTSELAIRAVVELGFTPSEARDALRLTDTGGGLRVDLAVDFLNHLHQR